MGARLPPANSNDYVPAEDHSPGRRGAGMWSGRVRPAMGVAGVARESAAFGQSPKPRLDELPSVRG